MTGIFGFKNLKGIQQSDAQLKAMAVAFQLDSRYQIDTFSEGDIHLGRASLGITNPEQQPIWNENCTVCILMAGEIFGYHAKKTELQNRGYQFKTANDAEFVLQLYLAEGEDFVRDLNGAFAAVIWDRRSDTLLLANDRLGFEPLYYAHSQNTFSFSSAMRACLVDPEITSSVDFTALGQFLTFDHVLGNRTFLRDVELLPPASLMTLKDGILHLKTYWKPGFPEHYQHRSEVEYVDELSYLLYQAVSRQKPEHPAGILLSGGLDSRFILGLLQQNSSEHPLQAYTMGTPNCDDVCYAKELANYYGIEHHFHELKPDYLIDKAEEGIRIADGMENVVHMHTLANLTLQAELTKIIYKGFLGDSLMGYFSHRDFLASYPVEDLIKLFFDRYPILFDLPEHQSLFSKDVKEQLGDTVQKTAQDYLFGLSDSCNIAADLFFQFDLCQRQRRLTLNGVRLVRSQAVVRTPFYDNDLVDFMLRVPQGYRLDRYLFKTAFVRAFPELAKIPNTETGLPMIESRQKLWLQFNQQIRWRLRAAGLKRVPIPQKRPYASYNQWFRGPLMEWIEDILFSPSFTQRGYFNQEYIRRLIAEHRAGQSHYKRIGSLISIELWHRQFTD